MTQLYLLRGDEPAIPIGESLLLYEKRRYQLHLSGDARVILGRRELPRSGDHWVLPIEFWVGTTILRVEQGEDVREVPVEVLPDPDKASAASWQAILADLEQLVAGLTTGVEGGRSGSVNQVGASLPLLTEALLPLVDPLVRSLAAIIETPREHTVIKEEFIPFHRTRNVNHEAVAWLGRHPEAAAHLRPRLDERGLSAPPCVPATVAVKTLDHPVNRYVAWACWKIEHALKRCGDAWAKQGGKKNDLAEWAAARAAACHDAAAKIGRCVRMSFLRGVSRQPPTEAALLVAVDAPIYSRFQRLARRFLSPLFDASRTDHTAVPVRASYDIYELWCFLALRRAIGAAKPDAGWSYRGMSKLMKGTGAGAVFTATFKSGRLLTMAFNPTFRSYWTRKGRRRWSLSGQRRPDIVVTGKGGGCAPTWLVLDAKYRTLRHSLAQAFESVHIYRDSLRDSECGGRCYHAALLAPARTTESAPWFEQDFIEEYNCGVFELSPAGPGLKRVARWVLDIVGDDADSPP